MKLVVPVFLLCFVFGSANAQYWRWVDYLQGGGGNHAVYDVHVPEGVDDFAYAVGRYRVTTTFYGQDTNVVNPYHAGDRDVYIAKIDSNGNYEWIVTEGGAYSDFPNAVCTDEFGNVYIAGTFEQTAYFNTTAIVGDVAGDVFVAKYNSDGVFQWVKSFSGPGWEFAQEIECDLEGNLFIGGVQTGNFNYEAGILPEKGFFVMKMDYDGNVDWCVGPDNISASANSWVWGMKYKDDKLYFSGSLKNTAKFGSYTLAGYAWEDCYIARLDMDGNFEDAFRFGGIYFDAAQDLEVTGDTIYAVGSYAYNVMFDTIPMFAPNAGTGGGGAYDSRDAFLAKFLTDGTCLWVKDIKGDYIDETYSVLINKKGNPVITGSYGQIDIDASVGAYGEIYVREYDTDGNILWTLQPDGGGHLGQGMAIEEDASGNYFFGGKIKGNHYFQDILVVCPNVINHTAVMSRIYPPLDLGPDQTLALCESDTVWFYKPVFYGSPVVPGWSANPSNVLFEDKDSIQVVVDGLSSVSYIVSNDFVTDTVTYFINATQPPVSALGADIVTCEPQVELNAGSDAVSYNWGSGWVADDSLFTVTTGGSYEVALMDGTGCTSYDQIDVVMNSKPVVDLGPDTDTCVQSITLDAGPDGEYYDWGAGPVLGASTFDVSTSGMYYVTVTGANLCVTEDSIEVTFYTLPSVDLGPDISSCSNSVQLNAGDGAAFYEWGSGWFVPNDSLFTVTASGTYVVNTMDANLCIATDTVVVDLLESPVVDLGPNFSTCVSSVILNAGSDGEYYDWGSGFVLNDSLLTVSVSGTYTVTVQGANLCGTVESITVTLNSSPVVDLGPDISTCELTAELNAGSAAEYYDWGTGNVQYDSLHTVSASGTYTVTVEDVYGCTNSDAIVVNLIDCTGLEVNTDNSISTAYSMQAGTLRIVSAPGVLELSVYDVSGNLVLSKAGVTEGAVISFESSLSSGLYVVHMTTPEVPSAFVQKIVIP